MLICCLMSSYQEWFPFLSSKIICLVIFVLVYFLYRKLDIYILWLFCTSQLVSTFLALHPYITTLLMRSSCLIDNSMVEVLNMWTLRNKRHLLVSQGWYDILLIPNNTSYLETDFHMCQTGSYLLYHHLQITYTKKYCKMTFTLDTHLVHS